MSRRMTAEEENKYYEELEKRRDQIEEDVIRMIKKAKIREIELIRQILIRI